jgi:hypothetical protein
VSDRQVITHHPAAGGSVDDDRTRAFGFVGDQEARLPQFILYG